MAALKPLTQDRAYVTIRSLLAPKRITLHSGPRLAVFVDAESEATYTGDSWEEIIKAIAIDEYAKE